MKKRIALFFLFISFFCFSQEDDVNYVIDFITTKQGLSHNYVSCIVSDDLNTKWIGTENGITKFNGYDYEYIKPTDEFKDLLNENIETLFIDKDSNLWIGTKSGGLSSMNIKNYEIKNFNHLIDLAKEGYLRITAISQDSDGNIWIGTWKNGVFVIDYKNDKLLNHYNFNQQVYSIVKDMFDNIWFCSGNRLYFYNILTKEISHFNFKSPITDLLPDKYRNKLWIVGASGDTKLYDYNFYTDSIENVETNITSNFSKKLLLDRYGRIWIGTWGKGLYRSNKNLTSFNKINLTSGSSDKLSGNYNTILEIHEDKNNVIWLATANGGVVKLLEGNGFRNANELILNQELKGNLNYTSIYKNDENIFVGTLFNGLYYGPDLSHLSQVKEIGNVKINTLYEDEKFLYVGTQFGYFIIDLASNKIVFTSKRKFKATSFLIDGDSLFIGSQQLGIFVAQLDKMKNEDLYELYSEQQEGTNKIESNRITSIKKDTKGNIWVSTYNGLHLFDKKSKSFINQSKLLNDALPSIIINSMALNESFIWLATPNGLIKLYYKNNKLEIDEIIEKKNGLNSDFICAITFDDNSNLWFSTHTEIVKYNTDNKLITSYGEINGVRSTSFNNGSFFNYHNELIFFGGSDNLTFFNPDEIKDFNTVPEIIFTNLRVNNKLIQYSAGNTILDENFNYASKIKLTHNDGFFSTSFVANDFLGNLNIKYRYLLEGFQDQWIDLQNRNEINFAGLSPGNYTLKVEASRDNQNWSQPKSIGIELLGSPWKSPLAILLYSLIAISILVYFLRLNTEKLKLKNNLEIARIDKEKEVELTEAKLNFFTNISHEFRTPLTLIIGPLKELLDSENLSPKILKNLSFIDKNTNRLLNLINQLLDFRKADHGLLKLNVSQGNFVRFSKEVFIYFKESAKTKNIHYKFKPLHEEIVFPFDRNKMEIVLCNIISNAIKYSRSGDEIIMKIDTENEFCVISIKDTGIGMNPEYLDKIFDRFFQIKSANTARMVGSGIGLSFSKKIIDLHHGSIKVTSEKNVGTEFIIKLSMDPKQYEGEINEDFMTTENIKAYPNDVELLVDNLNIEAKSHSILIIDDNQEILSYLKDILSDTYSVIKAEDGDSGFEKASKEIPDLIISDIMMPGKDGITLCKELKSQINTSHIPIILLTARTSTVFEIEGLKTGADDYITKPFNAKVIKARIASLLENREKIRSHFLNKVRFEPTATEVENDADTENAFIHKAILLVENNLGNEAFGIDNMVDALNMSQSTLYRKIKSLTGLSLTAFIRSIRLKKAAHLILVEDLNLNQIAYEVGFNDYKYFKVSFKKQFNCLPSQYKEKIQSKIH